MKKINFTLFGVAIGAILAMAGSLLFSALAIPICLWTVGDLAAENILDLFVSRSAVSVIGFAFLYSLFFSAFPGMIGGAAMADWLESAKRTTSEMLRRGISVGAVCGFVASFVILILFILGGLYAFSIGFGLLAICISVLMSLLGMKIMAKELVSRV